MRLVLCESAYPAIATHDLELIATAKRLIRQFDIHNAEFQFFYGLRDKLARQLVQEGFHVRVFIPYGNVWRFLLDGFSTFDIWHQAQRVLGLTPHL
jgi:proline dehydrogenase